MVKYNLMDQIGQAPRGDRAVKQMFFTRKPDALYAISVGWPGEQLVIRDVRLKPNAAVTMLGIEGPLKHKVKGRNLVIQTPRLNGDQLPCVHAYAFKLPGAELLPENPLPKR